MSFLCVSGVTKKYERLALSSATMSLTIVRRKIHLYAVIPVLLLVLGSLHKSSRMSNGMANIYGYQDAVPQTSQSQANATKPDSAMDIGHQTSQIQTNARKLDSDSVAVPKYSHLRANASKLDTDMAVVPETSQLQANSTNMDSHEEVVPETSQFREVDSARHSSEGSFAYVYLLGGVDPDDPNTYVGFLYNVFVSTYILLQDGSKSDVVVFLQWKYPDKNNSLPESQDRVLKEMNIIVKIHSVSKSNDHFFERLMMEKFNMWKMTEYERVMFFDADVMPLCNVDYIFHLSKGPNAFIKPNMIFPGISVPANGGVFLLEPSIADYTRLQFLIEQRFNRTFDQIEGWGRAIAANETWFNYDGTKKGNKWEFYAAHVDQGLLWHWMRYEKGTFSAPYPYADGKDFKNGFNRSRAVVQNWSEGKLESTTAFNFSQYSCLPRHLGLKKLKWIKRPWYRTSMYWYPFHSDIIHFMEKSKPWLVETPPLEKLVDRASCSDGTHYWFYILKEVNRLYTLKVDWSRFGRNLKAKHTKARQKDVT